MDRWIVVGIDFSDGAIRALEYAIEQAKAIGASVACVHAYEGAPGMRASDDPTEQIRQQLDVATELGADMIVIGADGQRGAASQGFVGTVASRLITTSRRPVLVVPAPLPPDR
jgi:nucleotide-binding universal stress UspA family protein